MIRTMLGRPASSMSVKLSAGVSNVAAIDRQTKDVTGIIHADSSSLPNNMLDFCMMNCSMTQRWEASRRVASCNSVPEIWLSRACGDTNKVATRVLSAELPCPAWLLRTIAWDAWEAPSAFRKPPITWKAALRIRSRSNRSRPQNCAEIIIKKTLIEFKIVRADTDKNSKDLLDIPISTPCKMPRKISWSTSIFLRLLLTQNLPFWQKQAPIEIQPHTPLVNAVKANGNWYRPWLPTVCFIKTVMAAETAHQISTNMHIWPFQPMRHRNFCLYMSRCHS